MEDDQSIVPFTPELGICAGTNELSAQAPGLNTRNSFNDQAGLYRLGKQPHGVFALPFTNFDTLDKVILTFLSPSFFSCKLIVKGPKQTTALNTYV